MIEAEQIMKRCQAGTRNYEEANNLHAACYGIIGKLLAQQEKDYECGFVDGMQKQMQSSVDKAVKRMAQPEQEPVAWVSEDVCKGQYIDGRPRKIWWECEKGVGTAFYTTSPQRTWVGLFNEEIEVLFQTAAGADEEVHIRFARAIEAKLKEKNT